MIDVEYVQAWATMIAIQRLLGAQPPPDEPKQDERPDDA